MMIQVDPKTNKMIFTTQNDKGEVINHGDHIVMNNVDSSAVQKSVDIGSDEMSINAQIQNQNGQLEIKIPLDNNKKAQMKKGMSNKLRENKLKIMKMEKLKDRIVEMNQNFEQMKIKLAYQHDLPKNGYSDVSNLEEIPEFMCQKWPNDYMFFEQMHNMYETFGTEDQASMTGADAVRQSTGNKSYGSEFFILRIFNTQFMMLFTLTLIFILNNNVFYKSQIIFTINLIVIMFTFIYLAKYLDYDGSHVLASLCQMLLFYIAH